MLATTGRPALSGRARDYERRDDVPKPPSHLTICVRAARAPWNRCAKLDEIEEAVLMTRSRDFGLTRPLAEAVLEVVETDPNPDGAALEYIVVAKLPRALAEVRALA